MKTLIEQMLTKYNCSTKEQYINAFKEIVQEITLYALSLTDFFDHAAFYGGTALRIFYGLNRFSEDLDFSLCNQNSNFNLEKYFSSISNTFRKFGLNFEPVLKEKTQESNIQSAFLKGNTLEHLLLINPLNDVANHIQKNEVIKIKFEIDVNPPAGATYEYKTKEFPLIHKIKIYDEASLFAGKVHAVLCRGWKNRVKGRDLYDLDFYIKNNCILNVHHLSQRMIQTGHLKDNVNLTILDVQKMLIDRIESIDLNIAKKDLFSFLDNIDFISIWSNNYFKQRILQLKSNEINLSLIKYDVSKWGVNYELERKEISTIYCSSSSELKNKINNINKILFQYICSDDFTLNFGNKTNIYSKYYVIEYENKKMFVKDNVSLEKLINILKQ